eukprot:5439219-Prymnesium_polylepis.1
MPSCAARSGTADVRLSVWRSSAGDAGARAATAAHPDAWLGADAAARQLRARRRPAPPARLRLSAAGAPVGDSPVAAGAAPALLLRAAPSCA